MSAVLTAVVRVPCSTSGPVRPNAYVTDHQKIFRRSCQLPALDPCNDCCSLGGCSVHHHLPQVFDVRRDEMLTVVKQTIMCKYAHLADDEHQD